MSYSYLASPYSAPDPALQEERFRAAEACVVWLLKQRRWVYSPIVHCHAMAKNHGLPTDFAFWQDYNRAMLGAADSLLVLTLPGWVTSKGVTAERRFARDEYIEVHPIEFINGEFSWQL